ncbi:hypothetical protein BpHYR1_052963 [Brachionus plicatilis]|uniref:Uncharacterized protein n=1 Tax=Brachionus plicatilis TaxID=10195 RepID=A0A3M7RV51_BRAPC|nr:hypothetical protein BpHYR1_052963 [Brachionus plicatilis]
MWPIWLPSSDKYLSSFRFARVSASIERSRLWSRLRSLTLDGMWPKDNCFSWPRWLMRGISLRPLLAICSADSVPRLLNTELSWAGSIEPSLLLSILRARSSNVAWLNASGSISSI